MKFVKRKIYSLCAIVALLSLLICGNVYADEGTAPIELALVVEEQTEDQVVLDMYVKNLATVTYQGTEYGISTFYFMLDFDETVFTNVTYEKTGLAASYFSLAAYSTNAKRPHVVYGLGGGNRVPADVTEGSLGKLTLTIADDVEDGKYTIGFANTDKKSLCSLGTTYGATSTSYSVVEGTLAVTPATIKIGEPQPGGGDGGDDPGQSVKKGYTADFITDTQSAYPTETVSATVEVGVGTDETANTYNAMQMVFSYDPALLTYQDFTSDLDGITVNNDTETGKITVTRYGNAVDLGNAFTLNFQAASTATGTATITLNSANIDTSENAIQDAPAATVTKGTHTVTFSEAATYNVTLNGEDVIGNETATGNQPYTFTVDKKDGYDYTVKVEVNGTDVTGEVTNDGNTYTIPADLVAGDIVVTVTKTEIKQSVDVNKGDSGLITGNNTATPGQDYTFTLNGEAGKEYIVTAKDKEGNDVPVQNNGDGTYTIKAEDIPASGLIISAKEKPEESKLQVSAAEYLNLDGASMWLVTATDELTEGNNGLAYGGNTMYYSSAYQAYCYLVISSETAEQVLATAKSSIAQTAETSQTLSYDKDVNNTGKVDINDAQMAYNMYNAAYSNFEAASMHSFLEADVNGDKTVSVLDARAIVDAIR